MNTGFCWGNLGGKRRLVRPRHKWKDNIKIDLQEVGWGGIGWIDLAQDMVRWRVLMNTVIKALYDPAEACSTNMGEERYIQGFGGETWGKETPW